MALLSKTHLTCIISLAPFFKMIQSHAFRLYLQDLYLYIFGQDFMTHLIHYPSPFDKIFVDINWPASRCWKRLNPPQTASGEYLVFIHIPKCAGTSITSHLGIPNFHLTANILLRSNDAMYQNCLSFRVQKPTKI